MGMYAEKETQIAINAQMDVIIPIQLPGANEALVMNLVELPKVQLSPITSHKHFSIKFSQLINAVCFK